MQPNDFLDLDINYADKDNARFVILPVGYDGTASFKKGCRRGPEAIIEASKHVELFDEQLLDEFFQVGIHTHPALNYRKTPPEQVMQEIFSTADALMADGKTVISLGGEHSITAPLVKAACRQWPKLSVLHFDAHADLRDTYMGTPYNHACVMRRIHDLNVPTVSVGIRSFCREQYDYIKANNTEIITPQAITRSMPTVIKNILQQLNTNVYVTIDIDVFDPAIAPGTGTPEPGGLSYHQVLAILETVTRNKNIIAADIVEVLPLADSHITEFLAARLAYKIIAFSQISDKE